MVEMGCEETKCPFSIKYSHKKKRTNTLMPRIGRYIFLLQSSDICPILILFTVFPLFSTLQL